MAARKKISKSKAKMPVRMGSAVPSPESSAPSNQNKIIVRLLIALVLIVCVVESMNLFHGETPKDFKVQTLSVFSGDSTKCGSFNAWGVGPVGKDKIMVVDQGNNRILVFDRQGNCLKTWGKEGKGPLGFHEPSGMTSDDKGYGYVMDTWNSAIKGYDENGKEVLNLDLSDKNVYGPRGICFDGKNFIIADTGSHRILLLSLDGHVAGSWGSIGTGEGQFKGPLDAASDGKGNYFIADSDNRRVQWLDQDGKVVKVFKYKAGVAAVAVDKEGRFYVSTATNGYSCVKIYSIKNGYLGDLKDEKGNLVSGDRGLAVSSDDVLMIAGGDHVALYQVPPATP
jgi:hypothetical protein